jgi:c-di-GMP-binding flagellar brake protein YcgR
MSESQRNYPRHEVRINTALTCLSTDSRIVKTRDISAGGMFLLLDNPHDFPIGEMAHIHYLDPLNSEADTYKDAVIVRVTDAGIALSFVELDGF